MIEQIINSSKCSEQSCFNCKNLVEQYFPQTRCRSDYYDWECGAFESIEINDEKESEAPWFEGCDKKEAEFWAKGCDKYEYCDWDELKVKQFKERIRLNSL